MRYYIAAAAVLMAGLSACSSQNSVMEAQELQQQKLTLQDVVPAMAPKTVEAKAKQRKFLKENMSRFKNRKLASDFYVLQARRIFNEDKLDSATLFFNRAWLMDSTNNDVYWGYGLVFGKQEQYDKSLFILYRALEKDSQNPRLLTDVATTHLARFYQHSSLDDLRQSKKLLEQALKLEPENAADTYYKLAVNSYYLRKYADAWDYLHQSIRQDKNKEDKTFIAALLEKEQDPQGVYSDQQVQ
ncbi:tetratricopeptide repeat protein [Pontibacter actiniarum]|uniref:Uncharacterized protein n=1 Tax=Pontibacter actiniarum TaxID=323450 RepID=A0A1X9YQ83_9BACT|nr:hypothetical protein [Pontibacter actiniarum]ARS35033.1 hypothetical protein CA264_06015 [Pontibacter actiniarum]